MSQPEGCPRNRTNGGNLFPNPLARFIAGHPEAYQVIHRNVRRAPLHGFPYGLLFRVHADVIIVVGVFHGGRQRDWADRWHRDHHGH
jgi:hypothetical protein